MADHRLPAASASPSTSQSPASATSSHSPHLPILDPSRPSPTNQNHTSDSRSRSIPRSTSKPEIAPDIRPYPLDDSDSDSSPPPPSSSSAASHASFLSPISSSPYPSSSFVDPLLTDLYQLTMCYAYWCNDKQDDAAVFDLFFRENPFGGEFTIFAGLEEVLRFVSTWRVTPEHVAELRRRYPDWHDGFWSYLAALSPRSVRIYAIEEGSIAIGRTPLIRVEGPLAVCQLMETTFLVLVNYASLVTTNAARHRLAVGPHKTLLEFGLRRAQGPDGAMSASRYSYIGGFDGTSNLKASIVFGIPCSGTHAHSFVSSFLTFSDIKNTTLTFNTDAASLPASYQPPQPAPSPGQQGDFVAAVTAWRGRLQRPSTNQSELAAFIAYAQAYPRAFLALVDTYDALESGLWNFLFVALGLLEFGYRPRGIRLDSGDLAYLSRQCRAVFRAVGERWGRPELAALTIVASNDLSENVLYSLREQGHEIDTFAIGTHLVTCKSQPALGCVYKLVQVKSEPRIKVSHDSSKITIPGRKDVYRLYGASGEAVLDLLVSSGGGPPLVGKRVLCRHPFDANKRVYVTPSRVQPLLLLVWDGDSGLVAPFSSLLELKHRVQRELSSFREDHLRRLNPTPYKLSVTSDLYTFMHDLWLSETPIAEIK